MIIAVFQWKWSQLFGVHDSLPIISFIPMFMFAVLFGLSMDYEVFLLSRIREAYVDGHDNTESVIVGITTTARVITSAALIMICVFLSFVFGEDPAVKMVGLGLATAVFVDATIVRMVLVPSTMTLMGRPTGGCRWLDRIIPNVDMEGERRLPPDEYEDGAPSTRPHDAGPTGDQELQPVRPEPVCDRGAPGPNDRQTGWPRFPNCFRTAEPQEEAHTRPDCARRAPARLGRASEPIGRQLRKREFRRVGGCSPSRHHTSRRRRCRSGRYSAPLPPGPAGIIEASLVPAKIFLLTNTFLGARAAMLAVLAWAGASFLWRRTAGAPCRHSWWSRGASPSARSPGGRAAARSRSRSPSRRWSPSQRCSSFGGARSPARRASRTTSADQSDVATRPAVIVFAADDPVGGCAAADRGRALTLLLFTSTPRCSWC